MFPFFRHHYNVPEQTPEPPVVIEMTETEARAYYADRPDGCSSSAPPVIRIVPSPIILTDMKETK